MKLLFDENLSRRLVQRLADLFPGSSRLAFEGLLQVPDARIWEYARAAGFAIVTADADFYELSTAFGPPPKVIWLRGWDHPTAVAEQLLRNQAIRVLDFLHDGDLAVLILVP